MKKVLTLCFGAMLFFTLATNATASSGDSGLPPENTFNKMRNRIVCAILLGTGGAVTYHFSGQSKDKPNLRRDLYSLGEAPDNCQQFRITSSVTRTKNADNSTDTTMMNFNAECQRSEYGTKNLCTGWNIPECPDNDDLSLGEFDCTIKCAGNGFLNDVHNHLACSRYALELSSSGKPKKLYCLAYSDNGCIAFGGGLENGCSFDAKNSTILCNTGCATSSEVRSCLEQSSLVRMIPQGRNQTKIARLGDLRKGDLVEDRDGRFVEVEQIPHRVKDKVPFLEIKTDEGSFPITPDHVLLLWFEKAKDEPLVPLVLLAKQLDPVPPSVKNTKLFVKLGSGNFSRVRDISSVWGQPISVITKSGELALLAESDIANNATIVVSSFSTVPNIELTQAAFKLRLEIYDKLGWPVGGEESGEIIPGPWEEAFANIAYQLLGGGVSPTPLILP